MAKAIARPLTKTFPLTKFDESGETTVTVAQATQRAQAERDQIFSNVVREWDDTAVGVIRVKEWPSNEILKEIEARLTLVDCNILTEDGVTPLFTFTTENGRSKLTMTESRFHEAWGMLPAEVCNEIVEYIHKVNPQWGANRGE